MATLLLLLLSLLPPPPLLLAALAQVVVTLRRPNLSTLPLIPGSLNTPAVCLPPHYPSCPSMGCSVSGWCHRVTAVGTVLRSPWVVRASGPWQQVSEAEQFLRVMILLWSQHELNDLHLALPVSALLHPGKNPGGAQGDSGLA